MWKNKRCKVKLNLQLSKSARKVLYQQITFYCMMINVKWIIAVGLVFLMLMGAVVSAVAESSENKNQGEKENTELSKVL